MLKIWGRNNSSNVQKVMWAVGEMGLAHERIDAGGAFGMVQDAAYKAMNPNSRIPTIDDDGLVLFESNAILRHLARKYKKLMPTAMADQARVDMWMDWQQTEIGPAFSPVFWGLVRTPEDKRDHAAIKAAKELSVTRWAILEAELGKHLQVVGNTFSVADIPLGIFTYRFRALIPERPAMPNLDRWYAGLMERPAFREHVADIPIT